MAPIVYHSSVNGQRTMSLSFKNNRIDGYYKNHRDGTLIDIHDQVNGPYFDSNIYPDLIRFLPLKTGYRATIPIYDFTPA